MKRRAVKINRRSWSIDLVALKREIAEGKLTAEHRDFVEKVMPGFCDFAGKIERWPLGAAKQP